jgi:hypothetical protein
VRDTLLLEFSYLTDGESTAGQLCPMCKGGSTGEHTLSVSRVGERLLWKCHRASCGFSGASGSKQVGGYGGRTRTPVLRGVVGRTHYRNATVIPEETLERISQAYYLEPRHLKQLGWDEHYSRVVLPVVSWSGEIIGSVLRSESGGSPKALSYTEDNAVGFFRNRESESLIVVEDLYSALRASDYINAAAILGTHLNDERISFIRSTGCAVVYLALDADAYDKVIGYVKKYRNDVRMIPVKLPKDLKNMSPSELEDFFHAL